MASTPAVQGTDSSRAGVSLCACALVRALAAPIQFASP